MAHRLSAAILATALALTGASVAIASFPAPVAAQATLNSAEQQFLMEAARGDMAEVALGRLAQTNASSTDVKAFGERMVRDHGNHLNELKALAKSMNVSLPSELGPEQKRSADRLGKLKGSAFDRAYMTDMVADHQKDIGQYEAHEKTAKSPELRAMIGKTLPVLREHLKMALQIHAVLGK